jgi:trypanothione-disulfide reductase
MAAPKSVAAALAYDLIVIGAGSGGLQAAWDAATLFKQKVAVIDVQEEHGAPNYSALGGTCVNVGCVPKKLFVVGATFHEHFKDAKGFGWDIDASQVKPNWKAMVEAKNKAVTGINHSYKDMFKDTEGLDFYLGWASFVDKQTVAVREGKATDTNVVHTLKAPTTLIACGGWPFIPEMPGREHVITSNEAFYLEEIPKRTLVVGGGYIAVEFASIFQSFKPHDGEVHLAYRGELFLRGFDIMVREEVRDQMRARGVHLHFNINPKSIELTKEGAKRVTFEDGTTKDYDLIMYATGRVPNTDTLNISATGVKTSKTHGIVVDEFSKTNVDNIYAIGDVTERVALTPVAIHEGAAFVRSVFGKHPKPVNHKNYGSAVFAIPQAASCGMTEDEAAKKISRLRVYKTRGTSLMHQVTGNEYKKYHLKIIVNHDDDSVVGVHMVSPEAAEVIQMVSVAMRCNVKMDDFHNTIGVHPTTAEDFVSMTDPAYYYLDGEKHEQKPAKL